MLLWYEKIGIHPINPPYQHTHPPGPRIVSTHPLNPPSQRIMSTHPHIHPININPPLNKPSHHHSLPTTPSALYRYGLDSEKNSILETLKNAQAAGGEEGLSRPLFEVLDQVNNTGVEVR